MKLASNKSLSITSLAFLGIGLSGYLIEALWGLTGVHIRQFGLSFFYLIALMLMLINSNFLFDKRNRAVLIIMFLLVAGYLVLRISDSTYQQWMAYAFILLLAVCGIRHFLHKTRKSITDILKLTFCLLICILYVSFTNEWAWTYRLLNLSLLTLSILILEFFYRGFFTEKFLLKHSL